MTKLNSSATVSWKLLAIGNPTIGLGGSLQYT